MIAPDDVEIVLISSIPLAVILMVWILISTTVIIGLIRTKNKMKCELKASYQATITRELAAIDTTENIAYGIYNTRVTQAQVN